MAMTMEWGVFNNALEVAAIERCARVATLAAFRAANNCLSIPEVTRASIARSIAMEIDAAIRALEDKP